MRFVVRGSALVLATALALALTACPGAPPPQYPIRSSSRVLEVLRARDARIHSLRATGTADTFGRQGRVRGTVTVYVRLPDHLRVDAFAFGNLVSSLVSNGERFLLLQGQQYLVGPARACVAAQVLGIPMEARDLASVLAGGAPLLSDTLTPPRWENGLYVVDANGPDGSRERIELELPDDQRALPEGQQTPRLHRVELRDRQGVRAEITYQGYRTVAGVAFPDRVRVVMPRDHSDTQLRFDQVQPDFVVPPDPDDPGAPPGDPFQLARPAGAVEIPVDCDEHRLASPSPAP